MTACFAWLTCKLNDASEQGRRVEDGQSGALVQTRHLVFVPVHRIVIKVVEVAAKVLEAALRVTVGASVQGHRSCEQILI